MHFKITTTILISAEKQQQEDKVVTKHELSCSSLQVINGLISFLVLFTIQSKYYPSMFAVFARIHGVIFMENFYVHFPPKVFVLAIYHFTWQGKQNIKSHSCFLALENSKS